MQVSNLSSIQESGFLVGQNKMPQLSTEQIGIPFPQDKLAGAALAAIRCSVRITAKAAPRSKTPILENLAAELLPTLVK
jgi:hypothetical protein